MKSYVMCFTFLFFALAVIVTIGSVFEYTTTYKNLAFDVRHALMESSKEAIIPIITYEYIPCLKEELEEEYCDINGEKEIEIIQYKNEYEFFDILMDIFKQTKKHNQEVQVDLLYYTNNPFLARIKVTTHLKGLFMNKVISIEEAVIES